MKILQIHDHLPSQTVFTTTAVEKPSTSPHPHNVTWSPRTFPRRPRFPNHLDLSKIWRGYHRFRGISWHPSWPVELFWFVRLHPHPEVRSYSRSSIPEGYTPPKRSRTHHRDPVGREQNSPLVASWQYEMAIFQSLVAEIRQRLSGYSLEDTRKLGKTSCTRWMARGSIGLKGPERERENWPVQDEQSALGTTEKNGRLVVGQ